MADTFSQRVLNTRLAKFYLRHKPGWRVAIAAGNLTAGVLMMLAGQPAAGFALLYLGTFWTALWLVALRQARSVRRRQRRETEAAAWFAEIARLDDQEGHDRG